jgi:NodT family efflux transporter outer membrane factor (OMF) lipoprotein
VTGHAPRLLAFAAGLSLALAGCGTVGPDYHVPEQAAAQRPAAQAAFQGTQGHASLTQPVPDHWWQLYADTRLDALVRQALQANTHLREAEAHLRRAMSVADMVHDEGGTHASAELAARRAREAGEAYLLPVQIPVINEGNVGVNVSYQFDLFGQLARAQEAAQAEVEASEAAADVVRVTVVAETVKAYVQGCASMVQKRVAERALALQQQSLHITEQLAAAGRRQPMDVARARAQVEALQAGLPRFDAEHDAVRWRLAALLGRAPQELPDAQVRCDALPRLPQRLPVGDGAALLKRRPDVRQAERQLAAATARIGVVTADLYPHIFIGASAGLTGLAEHLGEGRTQRWGLGPLISWQIPDEGARARVQMAHADAEGALAHFDGVVLDALRETETALSNYTQDLARQAHWQAALDAAQEAAEQDHQLHAAGRAPLQSSVEADRALTQTEMGLADVERTVALDQVQLFLALGGGWTH